MQANEENIAALCQYLALTQDPDANKRKQAETFLKNASGNPGFTILLLKTLELESIPLNIRQAAAVLFKNTVKEFWANKELGKITPEDRAQIKRVIVDMMLSVAPLLQKQLAASLELISDSDFPAEWQDLLPTLLKKFETQDYKIINGVLSTAHSIFKRYRHQVKSPAVLQELKYILEIFSAPMLQLCQHTVALVDQNVNNPKNLVPLFQALKLLLKIFYSLNSIDLPEFFEDHMNEWMVIFRKFLVFESTSRELVGEEDDEQPGLLHKLQAAIIQNINLYTEKYEEEFKPYLQQFTADIWTLLLKFGLESRFDKLVSAGIRFLASLATSIYHTFFKEPEQLKLLCEKIVIPNMQLRDVDIEMFEDNPTEYIRRDIEGSDSDTRRRAATELVKSLRRFYERECTDICAAYVNTMLQQYAANPAQNWQAKDVAIYLVTALAIRSATVRGGTTSINMLVPIIDFFSNQVLPELQSPNPPALVLKADALKFVTTFRQQLPKQVLPLLITCLESPNYVVHTYSALCIEKLLSIKDRTPEGAHVQRYTNVDIRPYLLNLLTNLFKVLEQDQSKENDYVMKSIMRVIFVSGEDILPFSAKCIQALVSILIRICANPTNPSFNHYLFEGIAAMIKNISAKNMEAVNAFEKMLFPPFKKILEMDVQEFAPYLFQILSLLLEVTPDNLSPHYMEILPSLLSPALWERTANIPAMVRLLQAYLRKGSQQILAGNYLQPILGIFQKLIASKVNDHEGFYILESVVQYLQPNDFAPYMQTIFTLIFTRLMQNKTLKFIKSFLVFMSLFIGKHGVAVVFQQINSIQPGLFDNILQSFWLDNIQKVNGRIERKMAAIAMTKLLVEPAFLQEPYLSKWPRVLQITLQLLEEPEEQAAPEDVEEEVDIEDIQGYENSAGIHSPLAFAAKTDVDPFPDIEPKQYLAISLQKASQANPGKFGPLIANSLPAPVQQILMQYFKNTPQLVEPYLS